MRRILWFLGCMACANISAAQSDSSTLHEGLLRLQRAYPEQIWKVEGNFLYWKDSTAMLFDDGVFKTEKMMSDSADLEDQTCGLRYLAGWPLDTPGYGCSPGTYRFYPFFQKMYGSTEAEVRQNLAIVQWPSEKGAQRVVVTKINGVHLKLQAIAAELWAQPHLRPYLNNIAGGFNWRKINGSNQYSPHSFGIAIDLNTKQSHYWRWDYRNADDEQVEAALRWRNAIPWEIVEAFERHGFIWGGKWYHYDTMHFEYRPEMLIR